MNKINTLAVHSGGVIAETPTPPYYAVIFTSLRTDNDQGYSVLAARMVELAIEQPGFLGLESARDQLGITISYWSNLESIQAWKAHGEHLVAQQRGRSDWYKAFRVRISKVEREYGLPQQML